MRGRSQCTLDGVGSPLRSEPLIFLFTGEGAHSAQNDVGALRQSNAWPVVDAALVRHGLPGLEALLTATLGQHGAPLSPVLTTVVNLLNAARWRDAGLELKLTIGHSISEVAPPHVADLFSMDEAIAVARGLGMISALLEGGMLHTRVTRRELLYLQDSAPATVEPASGARASADEPIRVAAINSGGADADDVGVTLCSPGSRMAAWLASDSRAKRLPPLHPWHHPAYAFDGALLTTLEQQLPQSDGDDEDAVAFISATKATVVKALDASYWRSWLSTPGARRSLRWRAGACLHAASPRSLARTMTRRSQLCGRRSLPSTGCSLSTSR
jgi:hypothetical protein